MNRCNCGAKSWKKVEETKDFTIHECRYCKNRVSVNKNTGNTVLEYYPELVETKYFKNETTN